MVEIQSKSDEQNRRGIAIMYSFLGEIKARMNDSVDPSSSYDAGDADSLGTVGESIENDNRKPHIHIQFLELKRPMDRNSAISGFSWDDIERIITPYEAGLLK